MTFLFPKLTVFLGTLGNINGYISKNNNNKTQKNKKTSSVVTCVWERMYTLSSFRGSPTHINCLKFTSPKALKALSVQPHCSQKVFPTPL